MHTLALACTTERQMGLQALLLILSLLLLPTHGILTGPSSNTVQGKGMAHGTIHTAGALNWLFPLLLVVCHTQKIYNMNYVLTPSWS